MSTGSRTPDAYDMAQCLDLQDYLPALSIWFSEAGSDCAKQVQSHSDQDKRCCYPGCCIPQNLPASALIRICNGGHVMHPECFRIDLEEKLKFSGHSYICYQCDDKTLDTLYRAIVNNANLRIVFPVGLTQAGASHFSAVQAVAVGDQEYTTFLSKMSKH